MHYPVNPAAPFPGMALFKGHYQFTWHFNDKATTFGSAKWIFSLGNCVLPAWSSSLVKHTKHTEREGRQGGKGQQERGRGS